MLIQNSWNCDKTCNPCIKCKDEWVYSYYNVTLFLRDENRRSKHFKNISALNELMACRIAWKQYIGKKEKESILFPIKNGYMNRRRKYNYPDWCKYFKTGYKPHFKESYYFGGEIKGKYGYRYAQFTVTKGSKQIG